MARLDLGEITPSGGATRLPRSCSCTAAGRTAHTWDTVVLGVGAPALAIDLPGHGRSAWREDGDYGPRLAAEKIIRCCASTRRRRGSSSGCPSRLDGAAHRRHRSGPGSRVGARRRHTVGPERHEEMTKAQMGTVALVQGDRTFPSFRGHARGNRRSGTAPRPELVVRRASSHNSKRLEDGTWTWRYDSFRKVDGFLNLWDDVPSITKPDDAGTRCQLVLRQRRGRRRLRQGRAGLPAHAHRRRRRPLGTGRSARQAGRDRERHSGRLTFRFPDKRVARTDGPLPQNPSSR